MDIKSPPIRQHNSINLILFGGENLFKGNQAAQRIKQKCLTESLLNPPPPSGRILSMQLNIF